jgi:phosphatidylglycerophosphate synthase
VALFEVRGILDCADGVVARLTGKGSPHGHAIDALGDSLSFVVFVGVLVTKLMEADFPPLLSFTLGLGLLLTTALAGIFHDQFKMQIADVLLGRPDRLAAEWKRLKAGSEKNLGLTRLRFWFLDTSLKLASQPYALQLRRAPRLAVPLTEELTPSRELRALIRAVSLVGGDNVLALLSFGLLAVALSPVPFHASVWVGTVVGSILYSVASVPHVFYRFSKFYQTLASKPERKS